MRYFASSPLFKFVVVGTFVGLCASNLGCRKLISKVVKVDAGAAVPSGTPSGPAGSEAAPSHDPDDPLREKIEPYIECLNSLSSRIRNSKERYLSRIRPTGPTGKEGWADIYELPKGEAAKCSTNLAKAKTMPPPTPALERAGEAFAKAATQLEPLASQLHRYFENKNYLDDHWAKAKELHPQLMAAFRDFDQADEDLHNALDGITKPLSQRDLARIEKEDGKKFRYHRKHVLNTARDLIEISNPDRREVDFNAYSTAMTEFEQALEDLTAYGGTHKSDLKNDRRGSLLAEHNYDSFVRAADDYRKAQKDFWRCLRDAPAKLKLPNGKINVNTISCPGDSVIDRVANKPIKQYNQFIETSNRSQF